ncbi:MAG: Ppx/GppA phosphatase family protein [Acidiferrobacter sp.]
MPKARIKTAMRPPKKIVKRAALNRAPVIAAVDLGSNSFHLVVAKVVDGKPVVVDRLREMLRFGSGLDRQGHIKSAAAKTALTCLRRFGQRLTLWRPELVRAVGTNTLRQANGVGLFLRKAHLKLGVAVEVISGIEEARLIYRGVSPGVEPECRTLVLDIGGGSTEIIVGTGAHPEILESVTMGCVTMTDQVLRGHFLTEARFAQAVAIAHQRLWPLRARFRAVSWERALGSSGTIRAVESVVRELGLAPQGLTLAILYELKERVLRQRRADRLVLPGLATERAPVFVGGLAILIALFEALDIDAVEVARGALREGILQDLMGRLEGTDVRSDAITHLALKWSDPYGSRASELALGLWEGVAGAWHLSADDGRFLEWAARLHACGMAVNHLRYEQHSAYIVANAELAGFARHDQQFLAALVGLQSGRWTGSVLAPLKHAFGPNAIRLAVLVRLTVALLRLENRDLAPAIRLSARGAILEVKVMARGTTVRDAFWRDLTPELSDMQKSGIQFLLAK